MRKDKKVCIGMIRALMLFVSLVAPGVALAERSVTMFVAVTGAPTTADVERKLDALAASGVDSFMFYPTSGLRMEYLGAEFFRCARDFAAGAAKRGMKMWLYDEYNWPSGSCRGRVPSENSRWRYSEVSFHRDATGGVRRVVSYGPHGWVTLLEPDGVRRFLELTYDAYARELGPWIKDGTIPGIFTDEPGHHVRVDLPPKPICSCRWWSTLPADYRAATGRTFDSDASANALDWPTYARLFGRRFRASYYDQARAAADRLGLLFCGHLISDSSPYEVLHGNGDPLLALRGESFPGIDEISSVVAPERISFFLYALADHAIARNGNGGMAELFACGPADMSPERLRRMINLAALHGVTRYFTVMSAMDLSWMEQMRGFTTVVGEYQPWFGSFRTILDEADAASAFARKRLVRDAAVRYPQDAIARMIWQKGARPPVDELLREIELSGYTPDLVAADEPSALPVVFAFDGAEIVDERTGRRFASAAAAVAHLAAVRPVEGRRRNVILRRAEDGTRRELDLNPIPPPVARADGIDLNWTVSLDAPNRHRVTFDTNGVGRIRLAAPLKGLRLAVRRHVPNPDLEDSKLIAYGSMCEGKGEAPPPYRIELDGLAVVANRPCDVLRPGLDSLYGQTSAMDLAAGEHVLRIVSGRLDDNYFLPVAVLAGAFVERENALSPLPEKLSAGSLAAAGLKGFAGTASYEAKVDLPGDAELAVASGNAFAQVLVDGVDLGTRAWAPFAWKGPVALTGKGRRLTVRVSTSLLPIFGDPKARGAKWRRKFVRSPLSDESDPGLHSVSITCGGRRRLNLTGDGVNARRSHSPKVSFERCGDWKVKVTANGRSRTFVVEPPSKVGPVSETFALPDYDPKAWYLNQGKIPDGLKSKGGCPTKFSLDPASVRISRRDGTVLVRGLDWQMNDWGCLGRLSTSRLAANEPVKVEYAYRLLRTDGVFLRNGELAYVRGVSEKSAPKMPCGDAGDVFLGTVDIRPETSTLGDANLFPVLDRAFRQELPAEERAISRCPAVWRKLRAGEPVKILCWGDSVTEGTYGGLESAKARWQEQFTDRLRGKFPRSDIRIVTNGWGGRGTSDFLAAPASDVRHHYQTSVLGQKADLVIVEFVNDLYLSGEKLEKRYGKIVSDFRAQGTEVIFLIPHYVRFDRMGLVSQKNADVDPRPYAKDLKRLAGQWGVGLADAAARWGHLWREGIPYMTLLVNDINHPNGRGMSFFADALMAFFD